MRDVLALLAGLALVAGCGETELRGDLPDAVDDLPDAAIVVDARASEVDAGADVGGEADAEQVDAGASTDARPASLVLPDSVALPYVVAGRGGSHATVTATNAGGLPVRVFRAELEGGAAFSLEHFPSTIPGGSSAAFTLRYLGSSVPAVDTATLAVDSSAGSFRASVFGVAGSSLIGASAWTPVTGAQNRVLGHGTTLLLPGAPFPSPGAPYADSSVRIFVPEGFRDRGSTDLLLHFHGHNGTIASTLLRHAYERHVYASGANAVLVLPQGPVNAASGNFGKLMRPLGTHALLEEVLTVLYRDHVITHPVRGDLTLTAHSGGYQAVAANLLSSDLAVRQANLFDALYGFESQFRSFAADGALLRSNYTMDGGTLDNNRALLMDLLLHGVAVATDFGAKPLRDARVLINFVPTSHGGATRIEGAYGESLRWSARHHRRGPRVALRSAIARGGVARVSWLAPDDEDLSGFWVETSTDGVRWQVATRATPSDREASFPLTSGVRVRVRPETPSVRESDRVASNVFRVDDGARILVVQHFDRVIDGSYSELSHDFAAVVGEAYGAVATVDHRALTEDGIGLSGWEGLFWLLGDQAIDDRTFTEPERQAVSNYLMAGGHVIVSGSEVAYDLGRDAPGRAFLSEVLGATFVQDDSGSLSASGAGRLSTVAPFTFGGTGAAYREEYPDALAAAPGSEVILTYGNRLGAGVGRRGQTAVVGFPLELIEGVNARSLVVRALAAYAGARSF